MIPGRSVAHAHGFTLRIAPHALLVISDLCIDENIFVYVTCAVRFATLKSAAEVDVFVTASPSKFAVFNNHANMVLKINKCVLVIHKYIYITMMWAHQNPYYTYGLP